MGGDKQPQRWKRLAFQLYSHAGVCDGVSDVDDDHRHMEGSVYAGIFDLADMERN